jgi:ectoine hydroxylase-related dioxygenase (phytanoyl-CoA dioxygenase family)
MNEQTSTLQAVFSPAQVAQYHEVGYVLAQGLLDIDTAIAWKEQLKSRLIQAGEIDEPSGVRVWMADSMDPMTHDRVCDAKLTQALQQLIGPNVEFLSMKAVFKNAKTTFASPWHQDWFYWQGTPKISVWIALDDADAENGCLRLIPRSHRQVSQKATVEDGQGFIYRLTDEMIEGMPVETLPVQRGDALFFHDLALHASCPNISGRERWTAIATYRDAAQQDPSTVWQSGILLSGRSVNGGQPVDVSHA